MIQQLYVIEASRAPEAQIWYIGRDIGRVGYYSPVRVFDEDGLFTSAVTRSRLWQKTRCVTPALARAGTRVAATPGTACAVDGITSRRTSQ